MVSHMLCSIVFPAFVSEYSGNEPDILNKYSIDLKNFLVKASDHLGTDLTVFDVRTNNFQDHELNTQYISYIFSCAAWEMLKSKKIVPEYLAGYSMGLYAALYAGDSVTFTGGLDLIRKAFELIKSTTHGLDTGMGSVVGLSGSDLKALLSGNTDVALANTNGEYSFLLSGLKPAIQEVLSLAKTEGALHTSLMNVTCPYHTRLLDQAAILFREYIIREQSIRGSSMKIVSGIDQKIITGREEIMHEITRNLNSRINWLETMNKLLELNSGRLIECGAGTSLYKLGKFIKGDFRIYSLDKAGELFV